MDSNPQTDRQAAPRRVLIVDDNADFTTLLAEFLTASGCSVQTATDGLQALELLRGGAAPDAIVTDARMPRLDGHGLLRHVRDLGLVCRIVVVTAFPSPSEIARFERDGAHAVLSKPLSMSRVLQALQAPTES